MHGPCGRSVATLDHISENIPIHYALCALFCRAEVVHHHLTHAVVRDAAAAVRNSETGKTSLKRHLHF